MQSTEDALANLAEGLKSLAERLHVMGFEMEAAKSNAEPELLVSLRQRLDAKRKYLEFASMRLRLCLYRQRWARFCGVLRGWMP